MKALTVWQPWSSLIAIGAKPYEFRGWAAPKALHGQRIAIHAGARPVRLAEVHALIMSLRGDENRSGLIREPALELLERLRKDLSIVPLSHIVCTAILGVPIRADKIVLPSGPLVNDSNRDGTFNFGWPLTEIEPLTPPVPARGAQGFWEFTP